jgi:peptidyl-prolyl cis-trans isomerase C
VEKEDEAKDIIASLKKGGKFEDIAKKQSKDPGSGANGGDLDWANAGELRARVLRRPDQAEEGPDHRSPVKTPVRMARDSPGRRA